MPPEILFLSALSLVGGTLLLLPLVRALAERIRPGSPDSRINDELRREVEEMRHLPEQLSELGERVDFLERLVAKQREAERLPPVR